ncbi:MAG: AarF/ABC1/UbiB kinase family protein [Desulfobacterales bacterium]
MLSIQKIGVIGRTYRHFNRYRQILSVFVKYGFGDLLSLLKIEQYIEAGLQIITRNRRERVERLTRAERVRKAFEELGPTFIKLGQIISTRPDLIPAEFIEEFSKLQDKVPPFPFTQVRQIIKEELGREPEELFESFDENPLASASIGQVHMARRKGNEKVVVKVQRPDIKKIIEVDLEIILHLATLMEKNIEEAALYRPVKIVEEFARTLEKEIDYTIEASSMELFGRIFAKDPTVYIPKVYRDTTTLSVLTMEYIEGIKASEVEKLKEAGLDPKIITVRGTNLTLRQVFHYGFFHADPHPGNFFVMPDNVIGLIDFGMVGMVDRKTREIFVDLLDSVVHKNAAIAAEALLKLTTWDKEPDIHFLETELSDFMTKHLYKPLRDIEVGRLMHNLIELISRHRLMLPPDIYLMIKALGTVEGVAKKLDPDFNMVGQVAPFLAQVKIARFYPQRIIADLIDFAGEMRTFFNQIPKDLLDITRLLRQGRLTVKIEQQGLETMLAAQHQISNRLSFSIIIAALLIGSALIVISDTPPLVYGISFLGIIGFLAAAIMGIWLLVAIVRKGL